MQKKNGERRVFIYSEWPKNRAKYNVKSKYFQRMLHDLLHLINFPRNDQREEKDERGKHGERERAKQKEERNGWIRDKSQPIFLNNYVVNLSEVTPEEKKKVLSQSVIF